MGLKRECLCGISVHDGTKIAAWIQICLALLMTLLQPAYSIFAALGIFMCALLLYGLKHNRPGFYIPYLVLTTIAYILEFIKMGYRFGKGIEVININAQVAAKYFVVLLVLFLFICFFFYLYLFVPYWSYKLLNFEIEETKNGQQIMYPQPGQVVLDMSQSYPAPSGPPPAYVEKY